MIQSIALFIICMAINTGVTLLIFAYKFKSKKTILGNNGITGPSGEKGDRGLIGDRTTDNNFNCNGFQKVVSQLNCSVDPSTVVPNSQ